MSTNLDQQHQAPASVGSSETSENAGVLPNTNTLQREAIELNLTSASVRNDAPLATKRKVSTLKAVVQGTRSFWGRQISLVVSHDDCRDHFANERTYLAYLRTSSAFATLGTTVRQLFLLQNSNGSSSTASSPYGEALAIVCMIFAAVVALSGAFRFWRQQNAMARVKAHAGGWEVYTVGVVLLTVLLAIFIIVLLADV